MLFIRVFRKLDKKCSCRNLRFLTTQPAFEKTIKTPERKYFKESSPRKLRPWTRSYLQQIFAGAIDKKVFEYPAAVSDEGFDTVLDQSAAVENFIRLNYKSKLTNDVLVNLKELDLFGLSVPLKFGGAGYNETEIKFLLECTGCNPTIGRFVSYKEDFGCRLFNVFGTEEQKQKYLPDLASGRRFAAIAYVESSPLLHLQKLEGCVTKDEVNKQYILNAEKKWVHYADQADLFLVFVKDPKMVEEEAEIQMRLNMFIVERDTPGVKVHKLQSKWSEDDNLYDVSFKNVLIPFNNILGGPDSNGFDILRHGLSHSHLSDATLCLSLMKRMLHDSIQFIEERNLKDITIRGHGLVHENVSILLSYIYGLESVVYLLAGSCDMHERSDLFLDAIMAKILGIEFLRLATQMYSENLGNESYMKSGVIEEALEALHFHSAFDENIENLKLMCAADGLVAITGKLAKIVNVAQNPFDNPYEAFKFMALKNRLPKEFKSQLNYKMELHSTMSKAADVIENNVVLLQVVAQNVFMQNGSLALYCDHPVSKMAEIASYIFASISAVSRASSSICYDINNYQEEGLVAQVFTKFMDTKIQELFLSEMRYSEIVDYFRMVGKTTFSAKEYPLEHPLSRAF